MTKPVAGPPDIDSIARHGARYLRGETNQAMVSGRVDTIRTTLDLHAAR